MKYTKPELNEIGNAESLVLGFPIQVNEADPVTGELTQYDGTSEL